MILLQSNTKFYVYSYEVSYRYSRYHCCTSMYKSTKNEYGILINYKFTSIIQVKVRVVYC